MKEILLGTIGSGTIVHKILDNATKINGFKLVACYSRDINVANNLKNKYHFDYAYDDIDEFVNDKEINTIYIASPNSLHYIQAKKALLAKKNVILEKPFTPLLSLANDLIRIANKNNVYIIDATPTFSLPNLEILKNKINEIGNIKVVIGNYSQYSSRYNSLLNGELPNVFNRDFAGGCLMDINYYNVYLTTLLFGIAKSGIYHPNLYSNGIDTSGVINFDYGSFKASLIGAKDTWGINYYEIEGDKGFIYVKDGPNGLHEIHLETKDKKEIYNNQPNSDHWYYDVLGFRDLLLNEDIDRIKENNNIMLNTISQIEKLRKDAHIIFKGD